MFVNFADIGNSLHRDKIKTFLDKIRNNRKFSKMLTKAALIQTKQNMIIFVLQNSLCCIFYIRWG